MFNFYISYIIGQGSDCDTAFGSINRPAVDDLDALISASSSMNGDAMVSDTCVRLTDFSIGTNSLASGQWSSHQIN